MPPRFGFRCWVLTLLALGFAGCATPAIDFRQQLPPGQVALRKISPDQYPDFGKQPVDFERLRTAIAHSQQYLSAPSSRAFFPYLDITHDRAVATLAKLDEICSAAQQHGAWDPLWFNQQIVQNFDVYKSYGAPAPDDSGYTDLVQFTGYCTPIYDASLHRTDQYAWPLYKLPPDLVRDSASGQAFGRRTAGRIVPYYTREEIETGGKLAGNELVWLKSRWDAYVVTVQGSARLRIAETGQIMEIGYAGTNGYSYTSPGLQMVADGVITQDQLSLRGLTAYFEQHPEMMDRYLSINQRYVFFTQRSGGPFGSLNVPVTPMATIATDKQTQDIYPRAMPAFLCVAMPDPRTGGFAPNSAFMLDQDTGGAIRASGRCDIYMGIGPAAQAIAGLELQEGALYYLAVKPQNTTGVAQIPAPAATK